MSFVPIVTPVAPPPSRQTQELADRLGRVIQEYEGAHPTVTGPEVQQALMLARRSSTKGAGQDAKAIMLDHFVGVALMVGLLIFFMQQRGG